MCPCSSFSDRAAWIYWQPIMSFLCLNTHMMMHYGTLLSNHYLVIIPLLATTWWYSFAAAVYRIGDRHAMKCVVSSLFYSFLDLCEWSCADSVMWRCFQRFGAWRGHDYVLVSLKIFRFIGCFSMWLLIIVYQCKTLIRGCNKSLLWLTVQVGTLSNESISLSMFRVPYACDA